MASKRRSPVAIWAVAMVMAVALAGLSSACATKTTAGTPATGPAPAPAAMVPDQPYVGTPRPIEQRYLEIIRLRNRGQTNEELLAKVRRENVAYSLSTFDIQKLRAADVSEEVIAAMLASGRDSRTTTPVSAPTPTPTPRGS